MYKNKGNNNSRTLGMRCGSGGLGGEYKELQKGIGGQSDILQLATELLSKLTQEEFEVFLV